MSAGSILIVEDSIEIRTLLAEYIHNSGYHTSTAGSAEDAWDLIKRKNFDLVIADMGLPGMDGDELVARMRAEGIHTSVILIAGVDIKKGKADLSGLKRCTFIQKPFDLNELGALIDKLAKSDKNSRKTDSRAKSN